MGLLAKKKVKSYTGQKVVGWHDNSPPEEAWLIEDRLTSSCSDNNFISGYHVLNGFILILLLYYYILVSDLMYFYISPPFPKHME